ncbi:MAG: hypothetical protein R2711_00230 [Acidimicrobiales bacterium]
MARAPGEGAGALRRRLRLPAALTVLVQAVLVLGDRVPSIDTMAYLESGTSLLRGDGYVRQGMPEVHFPPFVPVGLGLLHRLLGDELRAVQVWNLGWGLALAATVVAVAWRASRDEDATVLTAWAVTAVGGAIPLLIRGGGGSEAPAAVLVLGAALVGLGALDRADRSGALAARGAAIGALLGLAYLVRPEALLWGGLLVAVVALLARRRGATIGAAAGLVAATAAVVAIAVVPYAVRQHDVTGSWSITAKSREASIDTWADIARGDRVQRDEVLHRIDPDGVTLGPPMRSLSSLAADDPAGWLRIVATNVAQVSRFYLLWQVVPIFLLLPALHRLWRSRATDATRIFGAAALGPVATSLTYFALPRYLLVTTCVVVAYGCWAVVAWQRERSPAVRRWTAVGLAVGLGVSFVVATWPLLPGSPSPERTDQIDAGRWIDEHLPADAVLLTRSYAVQHAAHRPVVTLPVGTLDEVLAFGRRRGATHLVADETTLRSRRPELVDDLLGDTAPDGLALVAERTEGGRTVRIYAIEGVDPSVPPWPLPLGYVSDLPTPAP